MCKSGQQAVGGNGSKGLAVYRLLVISGKSSKEYIGYWVYQYGRLSCSLFNLTHC